MSAPRRRVAVLVSAAVAVAAMAGAAVLWVGTAQTTTADASAAATPAHAHEVAATPAPTATAQPPGAAEDAPGNAPELSLAEAASAPQGREGAEGLGAPRDAVDPAEAMASDAALGGCLAEYGEAGQCLSAVPPSMSAHAADMLEAGLSLDSMPHMWTCAEVRASFPDGIRVRVVGVDPQGLDDDGDGTACEPDS